MEKIVIHDLHKYKLVLDKEESIDASVRGQDDKKGKIGLETKLFNLLQLRSLEGWTEVKNPDLVFKIADENRLKVSTYLIKRIKPSYEFFEKRKKMKAREGSSKKKSKKTSKRKKKNTSQKK